jgi:hypothetical protein
MMEKVTNSSGKNTAATISLPLPTAPETEMTRSLLPEINVLKEQLSRDKA